MNAPIQQKKKPRFGCIRMRVESNHMIRCPDGIVRQFTVKEKNRFPKAKTVCICVSPLCAGKVYETEADLLAAHPPTATMHKQEETHVYAWWSDEPVVAEVQTAESKKSKPAVDYSNIIGLLSEELYE